MQSCIKKAQKVVAVLALRSSRTVKSREANRH
jgi:hypothetical protein